MLGRRTPILDMIESQLNMDAIPDGERETGPSALLGPLVLLPHVSARILISSARVV
jgi:hypothetical protein